MELSFKNKKLKKSLTVDKEIIKTYGRIAKKVKRRIITLNAAENLAVIATMAVLRLHPYKGDRKGEWSIDIHKNWRMIFEINHNPIPEKKDGSVALDKITLLRIVSVEDPH